MMMMQMGTHQYVIYAAHARHQSNMLRQAVIQASQRAHRQHGKVTIIQPPLRYRTVRPSDAQPQSPELVKASYLPAHCMEAVTVAISQTHALPIAALAPEQLELFLLSAVVRRGHRATAF
jgi:hypothetical protein